MQSSRGQRGHGPAPSASASPRTRATPGSPPLPPRFPWGFGAAFALLAAACVLVAAAPTPAAVEHPSGMLGYDTAKPHIHHNYDVSHDSSDNPYSVDAHAERIRDAMTRLVDPTAPWLNLLDARERSGGFLSHWLGGGEGVLSVKVS